MARSITQRELRNSSGDVMRGRDRGESDVVTRNPDDFAGIDDLVIVAV